METKLRPNAVTPAVRDVPGSSCTRYKDTAYARDLTSSLPHSVIAQALYFAM